jgi:hypothetical protein
MFIRILPLRQATHNTHGRQTRIASASLLLVSGATQDDYRWDVFVSYARGGPVEQFVRGHLVPSLTGWLQEELKRKSVFVDQSEIPTGVAWPQSLRDEHLRSRVLLCVFSRQYFESQWCQAELHSMLRRHKSEPGKPRTFVHAVVAHDCEDMSELHRDVQKLECRKFHHFTYMQRTPTQQFNKAIADLAKDIAQSVNAVPPWRSDFPVLQKPPPPRKPNRDRKPQL